MRTQHRRNVAAAAITIEEPEADDLDAVVSSGAVFLQDPTILEAELTSFGSAEGVAQLEKLREKYDSLADMLRRRLNAGELTYKRYLEAAEQVYRSALDNLHEVAVALKSVSAIDPAYIDDRLVELAKNPDPSDDRTRQVTALEERRSLLGRQKERVADLFAANESAMTALDKTTAAFAELKTGKGGVSEDAKLAIEELTKLAERYP